MGDNAEIYQRFSKVETELAAMKTTKAICQAIIDRIDERLEDN